MKQNTTTNLVSQTIGLDLGDKRSVAVVLAPSGEVLEELKLQTTRASLDSAFGARPACRIALEVGTHSAWIAEQLTSYGHEVLVANPRKVHLIGRSRCKSDRNDAESLARLARMDPRLLFPIQHRKPHARRHLLLLRARDAVVASRTRLINHCRTQIKTFGERIPSFSSPAFAKKARDYVPEELRPMLFPMLDQIQSLSDQVCKYDKDVQRFCEEEYPETARLLQVQGVGPLTALCFVLTLEDPKRFKNGRGVAAYLGLTPRLHESGDSSPELRITKAGDRTLRRLLVSCSQYMLGPFGADTDLRAWGLQLAERGGKNAKKRAVVATARKLASILYALWKTPMAFEPRKAGLTKESTEAA